MELNKYLDHTLLAPDATKDEIISLCQEAIKYNVKTVCINPFWINTAKEVLGDSEIGITTVIGFPLGATMTEVKADETRLSIAAGADEVDMVLNVGALKSGALELVKKDIEAVVSNANGHPVKVIIEACLLTNEEIIKACTIAKEAGANFVKTSTGFSDGGASIEDVKLMRKTVGEKMGVKASGGIRDTETALAMINAGASRIGASSSVAIIEGQTK